MPKHLPSLTLLFAILLTACQPAPTPPANLPDFAHIVTIVLENKGYDKVIDNPKMPVFNKLAQENVLLTNYYAASHPSLPNYIALIGGDTFGIKSNCTDCFIDAPSLPDLIEQSGRTWKTYQEGMPLPCFLGNAGEYAQKHNPFVYFDPVRLDATRCQQGVVPLTTLDTDLAAGALPNYLFITPNLCNASHDCGLDVTDKWLDALLAKLIPALEAEAQPYLVVLIFEEGSNSASCCGMPWKAGGKVAAVLISPQAKAAFQDDTPYSHYSLLKTISAAWGLTYLGHAADKKTSLILAPWK